MRSLAHSKACSASSIDSLLAAVYRAAKGGFNVTSATATKREPSKKGIAARGVTGRVSKSVTGLGEGGGEGQAVVPMSGRVRIIDGLCRRLDLFPETVETVLSFLEMDGALEILGNEPARGVLWFDPKGEESRLMGGGKFVPSGPGEKNRTLNPLHLN